MADIVGGLTVTNLPADPATGARQDGSNALLSTIDGHVDSLEVALGNSGDAPASSELQSASALAVLRGIWAEIRGLAERLTVYTRMLALPPWFDPSTGALKITGSGQTVTTVTTVSLVTNQASMGNVDAKTAFVDYIAHGTWASSIRSRIST